MITHWEATTFSGRKIDGAGPMNYMVGEPVCEASLNIGSVRIIANAITETLVYADKRFKIVYLGQERLFGKRVIKFQKKRLDISNAKTLIGITGLAVVFVNKQHEFWIGLGLRSDGKIVPYANKQGSGKFKLEDI